MKHAADRLVAHWVKNGLSLIPGVTEADLMKVMSKYDAMLPSDFRDYLMAANGMETGKSDAEFIRFWELSEIKSVAEDEPDFSSDVPDAARCLMFADWSINTNVYAIQLSQHTVDAPIYTLGTTNPISASFSDFVELYVSGALLARASGI